MAEEPIAGLMPPAEPTPAEPTRFAPGSRHIFGTAEGTVTEYIAASSASAKLAIVFGSYGALDQRQDMPAQDALIQIGFNILAVRPATNNWYQDLSEAALAEVLAQVPAYDECLMLGSDMGGYAALYFATAANASQVLAFSPLFSPDPAITAWDERWPSSSPDDLFHRPMAEALAQTHASITLAYDPQTLDQGHLDLIVDAAPASTLVPLPYADSPVTTMLVEIALFDPFVVAFVEGRLSAMRATIHDARHRSATYLKGLALAAARRGHGSVVEPLFLMSLERRRGIDVLLAYGRYLADARRPAAALPYIDEAVRQMGPHSHWVAFRGHLEEMAGDLPAAANSFALAAQYDPTVIEFHESEARILRLMISLNSSLAPVSSDERSAFAQLDAIKNPSGGELGGVRILKGIAASFLIVLAFWVLGGIFEMR